MALAANALTTEAAVEAVLGKDLATALVEQRINEVSAEIECYLGRELGIKDIVAANPEQHRGHGGLRLYLCHWPIVSVTKVTLDGDEITDFSRNLKSDKEGWLYRLCAWTVCAPSVPGLTTDVDYQRRGFNIDVEYKGGYVLPKDDGGANGPRTLPFDIEGCAIDEVVNRLNRTGGGSTGGVSEEAIPGGARVKWVVETAGSDMRTTLGKKYGKLNCHRRRWFC